MTTHIQGSCIKPDGSFKNVSRRKNDPALIFTSDTTFVFRDELEYRSQRNEAVNVYIVNPLANGVTKSESDAEKDHADAVMKARGGIEFSNMEINYREELQSI